jgi:hypothetical protein
VDELKKRVLYWEIELMMILGICFSFSLIGCRSKQTPLLFNFHVFNNNNNSNVFPIKIFLLLIIGCFHYSFYSTLVYTAGFKKIRYFVRSAKTRVPLLLKINYVMKVQSERKIRTLYLAVMINLCFHYC